MLSILAAGTHPRLYETPQDVDRLKLNVERFQWGLAYINEMRSNSDRWVTMTDDQLRAVVPAPGSTFAYGFSGCPLCGSGWPSWGAGGVANIGAPDQVICPKCKHVFPDADHPDTGKGWHDPKTGEDYYFIGVYNARAAQEITLNALRYLAMCYTVTGEKRCAHAAAVLFDRLADVYPTATVGSIDYPMQGNNGRLERPQYQTARVLVLLADYYDLLCNSPEFAAPSRNGKGTIRQHIEESIIRDGGQYCYDKAMDGHMALTNGEADYVRGALAAGIMLDDKKFIDVAITGPYRLQNFLDNCIDRDGQYYETSVGYSEHCLGLYVDMAEMLYNMRTNEYPNGINFYMNPRFTKALFDACVDIDVFGHSPRFGDWGADTGVITGVESHFSTVPYVFSEFLIARAPDNLTRDRWIAARRFICDGDVEARRSGKAFGGWMPWFAFHAEPVTKPKVEVKFEPKPVLGGRGIITLRSGQAPNGRAALVRYGPSLNHGHLDDMNLNFFGLGRELTYDLGYALGSAHVQVGWSKATASHNLVVVNEKSQMAAPGGGGSPYFYLDRAPVRAFEASSEASYASEGVKTYRRTMALVDLPKGGYLVDIFRVAGGKQYDLMWHFFGKLDRVTGATMGAAQASGSLAGPEYEWGKKVGPAGYLIGEADKPDYWNPPPGNGYGFLCNVARASSVGAECVATWTLDKENKQLIALRLLPEEGSELVTAHAPGIEPTSPQADYAILRRKGTDLASAFVSVVEPSDGGQSVNWAKRLSCDAEGAVGVEVNTLSGTDYILSSISGKPAIFKTAAGDEIKFTGQFGFLRTKDGKVERGVLEGGTELAMGSYRLTSPTAAISGKVTDVSLKRARLTVDAPNLILSGSSALRQAQDAGTGEAMIYLNREGYSHASPYKMKLVDGNLVTLEGDLVLARGQVGTAKPTSPDAIMNIVPLPAARLVSSKPSGYFRGKLIKNDRTGDSSTVIDTNDDWLTVRVKDPAKFPAGDAFTIYDVQPGDEFRVPIVVEG